MKTLLFRSIIALLIGGTIIVSCKKNFYSDHSNHQQEQTRPVYSTIAQFKQGISQVVNFIQSYRITAYLDTLPNGFPNINGRKAALSQFGSAILEKLSGNQQQIESGVYDVFHFDEATFSLISFLYKAYLAGDISAQTLVTIVAQIPLPPIPVANFQPPVEMVALNLGGDCCTENVCDPKIKILVTWTYKPACGNYEKKTSGYAARNTLTHMSGGKMYRFDAEVTGCPCPGTWTSKVEAPAGASYGTSGSGKTVTVLPVSPGTYKITFTYKVCDKEVSETFTLTID